MKAFKATYTRKVEVFHLVGGRVVDTLASLRDTWGTSSLLTVLADLEQAEADERQDESPDDEDAQEEAADYVARAALLGGLAARLSTSVLDEGDLTAEDASWAQEAHEAAKR